MVAVSVSENVDSLLVCHAQQLSVIVSTNTCLTRMGSLIFPELYISGLEKGFKPEHWLHKRKPRTVKAKKETERERGGGGERTYPHES